MKNSNKKLLLGIILLLIVILPVLIYLSRTQQFFRPRAAFGQITVNLVPLQVSKNIGEPFLVEVHIAAGSRQVSGVTVSLNANRGGVIVQSVALPTEANAAFTDLIYDQQADPYSFTVLSKKPTASLPTGSFKVATISVISFESGTHTLGINVQDSQAVGFNGTSEDVGLTVVGGTQVSYTMAGSLCRLAQCVATPNITLNPNLRSDNKYNVMVNFPTGEATTKLYKIYRNTGAAVPATHPDANLAGIAAPVAGSAQQFLDTNNGGGYEGSTNLHYDIDSYSICNVPTPTATPTVTPTP